jgi:hypothetical protein
MRTLMTMIAILILSAACAQGHDIYSGLKDHRGQSSCCDESDCRPAHYRITSASIEMLLDGEWVRVPHDIIQYRSLDGDLAKPAADIGAASRIGVGSSTRHIRIIPDCIHPGFTLVARSCHRDSFKREIQGDRHSTDWRHLRATLHIQKARSEPLTAP